MSKPGPLKSTTWASKFLGVKTRTLEDWRYRGVGPKFVKISEKCVRYRQLDLEIFIRTKVCAPKRVRI